MNLKSFLLIYEEKCKTSRITVMGTGPPSSSYSYHNVENKSLYGKWPKKLSKRSELFSVDFLERKHVSVPHFITTISKNFLAAGCAQECQTDRQDKLRSIQKDQGIRRLIGLTKNRSHSSLSGCCVHAH